jgi:hypothetical protein
MPCRDIRRNNIAMTFNRYYVLNEGWMKCNVKVAKFDIHVSVEERRLEQAILLCSKLEPEEAKSVEGNSSKRRSVQGLCRNPTIFETIRRRALAFSSSPTKMRLACSGLESLLALPVLLGLPNHSNLDRACERGGASFCGSAADVGSCGFEAF